MEKTKKLQNFFKDFLPQNFREFKSKIMDLTSNQAVVAELCRICCEENDVKAIKMAFERIIGKPEKVIVIKRTVVKTIYPDATKKQLSPPALDHVEDEFVPTSIIDDKVVMDQTESPGIMLQNMLDKIGDIGRDYAYQVIDKPNSYSVVEVMVCNLYSIAMSGANLEAIRLLFDYLDGAVADVIRLDGEDTILLENYADIAPYEAKQDSNGVWYVESEAVK